MKSLNYLKLMVTKYLSLLVLFLFIILISSCDPPHALFPYKAVLKIQGKISASIYPENKTMFKVGDSIRIISKFNVQDLDNWSQYKNINRVHSNLFFYALDTILNSFGEINSIENTMMAKNILTTKENDPPRYFEDPHIVFKVNEGQETYGITSDFRRNFLYVKQNDGSYALDITIYFKKPIKFMIMGNTPNENEATYNKYEAATEEERRKGVRVQLYVGKDHAVVPVVFTNNNQNYVPITVIE